MDDQDNKESKNDKDSVTTTSENSNEPLLINDNNDIQSSNPINSKLDSINNTDIMSPPIIANINTTLIENNANAKDLVIESNANLLLENIENDLININEPSVDSNEFSNEKSANTKNKTINTSYNDLKIDNTEISSIPATITTLTSQLIYEVSLLYKDLSILDLSYNTITKIQNLHYLPSLKLLNLSYNNISILENIEVLPSLTILNVSHNQITRLSLSSIFISNSIEVLDLSFNQIERFTDIFTLCVTCSTLLEVYVEGNPFYSSLTQGEADKLFLLCPLLRRIDRFIRTVDIPPKDSNELSIIKSDYIPLNAVQPSTNFPDISIQNQDIADLKWVHKFNLKKSNSKFQKKIDKLNSSLNNKDKIISTLEIELSNLKAKNSTLENDLASVNSEIQIFKLDNKNLKDSETQLRTSFDESKLTFNFLLDSERTKNEKLMEKLSDSSNSISNIELTNSILMTQIQNLKTDQLNALFKFETDLLNLSTSKENEIFILNSKLSEFDKNLLLENSKIEMKYKNVIENLNSQLSSLQISTKKIEADFEKLHVDHSIAFDSHQSQIQAIETSHFTSTLELKKLIEDLQSSNNKYKADSEIKITELNLVNSKLAISNDHLVEELTTERKLSNLANEEVLKQFADEKREVSKQHTLELNALKSEFNILIHEKEEVINRIQDELSLKSKKIEELILQISHMVPIELMESKCRYELDAKNLISAQLEALIDGFSKLQEQCLAETKEKIKVLEENKILKSKLFGYEDLVRRVEEKEGGINECYREYLFSSLLQVAELETNLVDSKNALDVQATTHKNRESDLLNKIKLMHDSLELEKNKIKSLIDSFSYSTAFLSSKINAKLSHLDEKLVSASPYISQIIRGWKQVTEASMSILTKNKIKEIEILNLEKSSIKSNFESQFLILKKDNESLNSQFNEFKLQISTLENLLKNERKNVEVINKELECCNTKSNYLSQSNEELKKKLESQNEQFNASKNLERKNMSIQIELENLKKSLLEENELIAHRSKERLKSLENEEERVRYILTLEVEKLKKRIIELEDEKDAINLSRKRTLDEEKENLKNLTLAYEKEKSNRLAEIKKFSDQVNDLNQQNSTLERIVLIQKQALESLNTAAPHFNAHKNIPSIIRNQTNSEDSISARIAKLALLTSTFSQS